MGASQSADKEQYGFHVLKVAYIIIKYDICFCFNQLYVCCCVQVKENSPAFHAGIEEFFDYIVSINDQPFVSE
jgi:hypothetical protein